MQSTETWKSIPGYEGLYEASDTGRVRSVDREVTYADGTVRQYKGQVLTPSKAKYWRVSLSPESGKRKTVSVHVAVLAAFVGPRPTGHVARHLNDNKDDNRLANLAYGTYRENQLDTVRNGNNVDANKTHCPYGHRYDDENVIRTAKGHRQCRACDVARQRRQRADNPYCINGHLFDEVGTKGRRVCSTCRSMRAALRAAATQTGEQA